MIDKHALKDFIERLAYAADKATKQNVASPKVMKKLIDFRYEKKYRKLMKRMGISVSEEELKKGTEEDGADRYENEVQDEDLAE